MTFGYQNHFRFTYSCRQGRHEWGGFNSQLARQSTGCTKRGPSMYLFGPLINAPPAHPDTVLTSVMCMMQSLTDIGMTYIHLSPDMQLYIQAMQIKLNEPHAFDKLILRPGVMHIVPNVCGCIGQLMMGSVLADLIGSAFGGVGSIMAQGKPWVHAMGSFRMVYSVLLQSLLQTGFKTWDEICEYLEKTRLTSYKPSLGGQPHHSDSPHSPVAALRKRERLALTTALHSTSPPVLFHRWPPQLCKIPLMALPRNGYTIACHGKG